MKRLLAIFCLTILILLAGCTTSKPTVILTPTSTPLFIYVPTPTNLKSATPRPTLEPTQVIISGTVVLPTPTITPTFTPTPTPTPVPVNVSVLPDPSGYSWQMVLDGLNSPEGFANAGDGSGRLFIVEQAGLIRILKDGALLGTPFLDLTSKVDCCGERGLLGLAFHPKYTENGFFLCGLHRESEQQAIHGDRSL